MRGAVVPRRLDRSGVLAGVLTGVLGNLTPTAGGVSGNSRGGCQAPPVHSALSLFGFVVLDRLDRTAPAERERTGATPPFRPLARHGAGGVSGPVSGTVSDTPPPLGGSLPSPGIPAGRLPGPHAGRTTSRDEWRDA